MSIEAITSNDFDNSDLDEIKQLFNELNLEISINNQRMVRRSLELPPAIWIFIFISAWYVKPFFSGFFCKMGEDAYDNFKLAVKKTLEKRKRDQDTQLRIHVKKDDVNEIIALFPTDSDKLKIALDSLPKFLDANPDLNRFIQFENDEWKAL